MEEKLKQILEKAKIDRNLLHAMKVAFVNSREYELAAYFRDMEKENFPLTPEQEKAEFESKSMQHILSLADLNVTHMKDAWVILQCSNLLNEKGDDASLTDVAEIKRKASELFF